MLETLRPDPTFYPSPRIAMEAPAERLAYTLLLSPDHSKPDALAVVDVDRGSPNFGKAVYRLDMPYRGDEFHHFGWNACSSALSPFSSHPFAERRYLIIPGIRSSRIYIVDTKPDPARPTIVKIIEPDEVFRRTGYSRPHTVHCGPEGIYISTLGGGGADGTQGPPGVFIMDCVTFEILGRWELDRGPQKLHYDFWWNLPRNYMVTSEWGLPPQFENGVGAGGPSRQQIRPRGSFLGSGGSEERSDDRPRRQSSDGRSRSGPPMTRPRNTDSSASWSTRPISKGSIWTWRRENGKFTIAKTATIPPEPADKALLPDLLKGFGAAPPFVTDIDLSLDDRFLYVACWGTGELRQYDVSDPMQPKLAGSVRVGGIARRAAHPNGRPFDGGPQMVEISRDGKRIYFTNSLYSSWDRQFYPQGLRGVQVMCNADPNGGITLDPDFFVEFDEGYGSHQVRLEGGDCSTDSFCYPSA